MYASRVRSLFMFVSSTRQSCSAAAFDPFVPQGFKNSPNLLPAVGLIQSQFTAIKPLEQTLNLNLLLANNVKVWEK